MLQVINIHKDFENKPLLDGVSLEVMEGELVCLLGSSGSGKSTLLRIIAGLEEPKSGSVLWNGEDYTTRPAHLRAFGLMFQDYALFPHKTVTENIAFGLRMQGFPAEEINRRVKAGLATIRMQSFAERPVTELSGGEQQRVALARALAPDPHLLMLDEPLGALDHTLRMQLSLELRKVLHESQKPVIYVTHDREEAFSLADRLLILHDGRILQDGTPQELFEKPCNAWVAEFLGLGTLVPGEVSAGSPPQVKTALGSFPLAENGFECEPGQSCTVLLRPEDAIISPGYAVESSQVRAAIRDSVFMGDYYRLDMEADGVVFQARDVEARDIGEVVNVSWQKALVLWPGD